jgi:hypothetical protein
VTWIKWIQTADEFVAEPVMNRKNETVRKLLKRDIFSYAEMA